MTRRLLALLALCATPLLVAACGGDDGGGDEDDITAAIEQAATEDSAEKCTEAQTLAFTEQTEFEAGEAAVETCESNAGDGDIAGESVDVSNVEVDGDAATADVSFEGGGLGGQEIAVSLVKEDDQWKLDSLDEFISFDKAAFAEGLSASAEADGDIPPETLTCITDAVSAAPDEELQATYLSGDPEQLLTLFGPCLQGLGG
jgi:hypothetical protein